MNNCCRDPLQLFCPAFVATPVSHSYYLRSSSDDHLLLLSPVRHNSLDLFRRSFLGTISHLLGSTPSVIRLRGATDGWLVILKLLQKHFV